MQSHSQRLAEWAKLVYHRIPPAQIESFRFIGFHFVSGEGPFEDLPVHVTLDRDHV